MSVHLNESKHNWALGVFLVSVFVGGIFPSAYAADADVSDTALQRVLNNPADAEASFQFARAATEAGDIRGAIAALERILVLNPGLSNIKLELGILYLRVGSNALAERFIREALSSPDAPSEVKARAQAFLEAAEAFNEPFASSFSLAAGLIADSNANSAPETDVTASTAAAADVSAYFQVGGNFSYDLGTQAGHRLTAGLNVFGRKYFKQSDLETQRIGGSLGGAFNLAPTELQSPVLQVNVDAATYTRAGESFLTEYGPSVKLSYGVNDKLFAELSAFALKQNYKNTSTITVNNDRDGVYSGLTFGLSYAVSPQAQAQLALNGRRKTAQVDYEGYTEYGFSANYVIVHEPWLKAFDGNWRSTIKASAGRRSYDGPDPAIDPTSAQKGTNYQLSGTIEAPLGNNLSLLTEAGIAGNVSNYAVEEYQNQFISVGISKQF